MYFVLNIKHIVFYNKKQDKVFWQSTFLQRKRNKAKEKDNIGNIQWNLMPKDTKSLGNDKAPACESWGFVHKKGDVHFDTPPCWWIELRCLENED